MLTVMLMGAVQSACSSPRPTEFINITFTPSVDTDYYHTWDFELDRCEDTGDPRVDDAFLRKHTLAEIERVLTGLGYERRSGGQVDCRVSYQFELVDADTHAGLLEGDGRGRIYIRDVETGRFVWRGERRARIRQATTEAEGIEHIRVFVDALLAYVVKLEGLESR